MKNTQGILATFFIAYLIAAWGHWAAAMSFSAGHQGVATGGGGSNNYGQSFTPSIPGDGSGLPLGENPPVVYLTDLELTAGAVAGSGSFYLNIYDGFVSPDGIDNVGSFVGSSINTFTFDGVSQGTSLTWQFNLLPLDYNHEYYAVFSTTNTDGGISAGQSLQHRRPNEGTNYSGGALLNNNQKVDDLVDPPTGRDALFLGELTTLPEPSSFALAACGAVAILVCLWWRRVAS